MSPRAALGVLLVAFAALGAGCALNQRLVIARAPYGVSDLVFAADRQLEIKPCDGGGHVWAQLPVMFVAGRPVTEMMYRLEQQSAEGGEFREVGFPYELRLLTKPEAADQRLTAAWRGRAADVSPPMRQEMQQQMVRRATDAKREVRRREEWRCEVTPGTRVVTFEGNRLLGKHMFALIAPGNGFHTGGHYRLTFSVPPSTSPATDEMARLAAGGERGAGAGAGAPEDVIGRIELTMVKNSNLIGVPVGIGLIIGFLILTTL